MQFHGVNCTFTLYIQWLIRFKIRSFNNDSSNGETAAASPEVIFQEGGGGEVSIKLRKFIFQSFIKD